jgi:hypothetical protein
VSKTKSLHQLWVNYLEIAIPKNAGTEQVNQTRMAFYSGAAAVMNTNLRIGEPDIAEGEGTKILDDMCRELADFSDELAHKLM